MIRKATLIDAQRIAEIIVYGWRFAYKGMIDDTYLYGELSVVKRYQSLSEVLSGEHGFFVYEEDGIMKAFVLVSEPRESAETSDYSELVAIYVEPQFKGMGIGQKLIAFAEELSLNNQKNAIRLWVLEKNEKARAFYEKCGFVQLNENMLLEKLKQNEVRYEKVLSKA